MKILGAEISPRNGLVISFLLGLSVRLLPELLSYPNVIGFDTIYYAARLHEGVLWYHWSDIFTQTWLLYSLIIPIHKAVGANPAVTLKIASPIIYGLNAAGIYYFANKTLKWKRRKSLITALFFSFSIASLRIIWDLYRYTLGLSILVFAVSLIPEIADHKKTLGFIFLSTLTVFSHELTAVSLIFIAITLVLREIGEGDKNEASWILGSSLPALIIFILGTCLRFNSIGYVSKTNHIMNTGDVINPRPLGLFFLTNYLSVSSPVESYDTYLELALDIIVLFTLLYGVWLPLIIKGFFKNKVLDAWTIILLAGSLGPLIVPSCSLRYWDHWMFMLVYPFTFYAVNGIEKFRTRQSLRWLKNMIIIATILLGILFTSIPISSSPFYTPLTYTYLPSSMQQNTIPLEDVEGTIKSLEYLSGNMDKDSVALVHHAFISWARLYLNDNQTIIYFAMNITKAIMIANQNGFKEIYLIWWKRNIGWYPNINVPEDFEIAYSDGRIGIFQRKKF